MSLINEPLKRFTNPRRLPRRPDPLYRAMPRRDRGWWSTKQRRWVRCPSCGGRHPDPITVLAYVPALDRSGEQAARFPGWAPKGWLLLSECRGCCRQWYSGVADDEQIREWGARLGGWSAEGFAG